MVVCSCKNAQIKEAKLDNNAQKLADDIQQSFLNLLNDHLPKDLLQKTKEKQTVKILSIACGRFREASSLFKYFSGYEEHIKLYGIDTSKELLDQAKEDLILIDKNKSTSLKLADASLLESYHEWLTNGLFNLIIIRHPEITFNTDIFIKIFSTCATLLEKNAYILITTHFENEKEALLLLLKMLKLKVVSCLLNDNAPIVKKENESLYADRFMILVSSG